ncbi:MAG: aminotransferase class III-fold pyridoxal phosphate-dependent enzyme, partial [Thermoguttaceae bacterium]|nr:aminotransferase class III-fold pyridoxal phosphate-dependent enzyme [Thermoguttaceae bacterium]
MNREKSRQIFEKALTLIPGGVNSPARAFGGVGGAPVVIDRAEGPFLFDVDGNRYIDYVLSWGPMILGHADQRVVEALTLSAVKGTSYGAPTQAENDLAELVVKLVPSMEK